MKQPKRLSRMQKILVSGYGLDPGSLALVMEDKATLVLKDKSTGTILTVPKKHESEESIRRGR